MDAKTSACFHCGEPLPHEGVRELVIDGAPRALCCPGCEAAVLLIRDAGLSDYYRVREQAGGRVPERLPDLSSWDNESVVGSLLRSVGGERELALLVEGVRCAACAWLIERALAREPGVVEARLNVSTKRLTLRWRADSTRLSRVLAVLVRLGYVPHLPNAAQGALLRERRTALKRLLVAALGMMQAMMFAEALYFGAGDNDPGTRAFFRWLGLLLSTPVVFYSGWPFLIGAWRELKARRAGMDLLVGSTVLIAYGASLVETLRDGPAVYFDSAVMFVFLLLATRMLEQSARAKANAAVELLARRQPASARRVEGDAVVEVPAQALRVGDLLRLRPGDVLAADGVLACADGEFDEALLSGESRPVAKRAGSPVLAGSHCLGSSADVRITRIGADTTLAEIVRLVERAQSARPRAAELADRVASYFVVTLFLVTLGVAAAWSQLDPPRALPVALALLAISCPCALALAVPAVLSAAYARLARAGVLALQPNGLETLARVDLVVFDKTGTLSEGRPRVAEIETIGAIAPDRAAALAAALERDALHPLAHAFVGFSDQATRAERVALHPGAGIEGEIAGTCYRLGTPAFAGDTAASESMLVLADRRGPLARFRVEDSIRNDARGTCVRLAEAGYSLALLSGDAPEAVASAAAAVGIDAWRGRQLPQQKLDYVAARQREGHVVAMFGDGVNDAAVLAGADVSIALGSGAALAHAAADFVLLDARLAALPEALAIARAARRIVRQNLAWAVAYNLAALPLAALGLVPPWAAALGMSVSSLVVTLNALRLAYVRCGEPQADRVGGRPRPAPSAALPPSCVQADAGVSA